MSKPKVKILEFRAHNDYHAYMLNYMKLMRLIASIGKNSYDRIEENNNNERKRFSYHDNYRYQNIQV
jgi:hypothetical protein